MSKKGEEIKDQGFVPYAKTKMEKTSKGPTTRRWQRQKSWRRSSP